MNRKICCIVLTAILLIGLAWLLPAVAESVEGTIVFHCVPAVLRGNNPGLYLSVELINQTTLPADLRFLEVKVTDDFGTRAIVPERIPEAVVHPGRTFCFPLILRDNSVNWESKDLAIELSCGQNDSSAVPSFGVVEGAAEILKKGSLFTGVLLESRFPEFEITREDHLITLGFYDSNRRFLYAAEVLNDDEIPASPGDSVWLEWSPFRKEVSEESLILAGRRDIASVRAFTTYPENEENPLLWHTYAYRIQTDGSVQISGYFGNEASVKVPAEIDGYPVTSLAEGAFCDHEELQKLELPQTLVAMEQLAVSECIGLREISLPASLQEMAVPQFFDCPVLEQIQVAAGCKAFRAEENVLFRNTDNMLIRFPPAKTGHTYSIPRGTAAIADGAFNSCKNLTWISFPEGIKKIGDRAFEYCDHLQNVTLPSSLTDIGEGAFMYTALTSVAIPGGVTAIPEYCFTKCENLESVTLPDALLSIGQSAFRECPFSGIDLPDGLQSIGDLAFMQCYNLNNIRIPASVKEIGMAVFSSCTSLYGLTLESENDRFELTGGILYDQTEHRLICALSQRVGEYCTVLPGTLSIDPVAFSKNNTMISVILPDGLLSIGDFAFSDCTKLKDITIPESVTSCGFQVFEDCSELESAVLPDAWTVIPTGAFVNCKSLRSVHLPASLLKIEKQAFRGCSALTSVTLPAKVRTIEDHAFGACSSLSSINLPASLKEIGEGILYLCPEVTASVSENSTAQQYCRDNGIHCKISAE